MFRSDRVPLLFLFIGSVLGAFLRWQFISPTHGVNYSNVLHGHSHVMFLGWIFNVIYIGFVHYHISDSHKRFYQNVFWFLQVLVVAMLISFPLQGYGFFSILFSTVHTLASFVFVIRFLRDTRQLKTISIWYSRASLIFFLISSLGPFSLGYLMANGLGQTNSYYFSIYFYLHFQYNGFFFFGVLSLLNSLLESRGIILNDKRSRLTGWIFFIACFPAYFLSTLWASPGLMFNIIGGVSALLQAFGFFVLIRVVYNSRKEITQSIGRSSIRFLWIASLALAIKLMLQCLNALPEVARLSYEFRPLVIAYLHLMLVGVITLGLLVWYIEVQILIWRTSSILQLFLISFFGMEVCITLMPWWASLFGEFSYSSVYPILIFSFLLSVSFLLMVISSLSQKAKRISF